MPVPTRAQFGFADQSVAGPATSAGSTTGPNAGVFTNTLTFAANHNLQAGDQVTLAGVTPSAWNGTWTVATVVSPTVVTIYSTISLGTITVQGTSTLLQYNPPTPPTPSRFFELRSEALKTNRGRLQSQGLRSGTRVLRNDRQAVVNNGAAGDLVLEPLTKGFGYWLKYMFGSVATAGPVDAAFTHTGTIGPLEGKSFAAQPNRPFHPADADNPFTFVGGKVTQWKLENAANGLLVCTLSTDYCDVPNSIALASASYPSGVVDLLSFAGGTVTIGAAAFDVIDAMVNCNNKLKTDRQYLRGDTRKKEPVDMGFREISWALTADFDSMAQYNRFTAANAQGLLATIVLKWQGPNLIGASTFPSLTITIDEASFDQVDVMVNDAQPLTQKITGAGLFDGTTSALTAAYVTLDATP